MIVIEGEREREKERERERAREKEKNRAGKVFTRTKKWKKMCVHNLETIFWLSFFLVIFRTRWGILDCQ